MNCPVDGTVLAITDRQGIEVDYCPKCRGVWLDRGELDKLIERSASGNTGPLRTEGISNATTTMTGTAIRAADAGGGPF